MTKLGDVGVPKHPDETNPKPNVAGMAAAALMMQEWLRERIDNESQWIKMLESRGYKRTFEWNVANGALEAYRRADAYLAERLACAAKESDAFRDLAEQQGPLGEPYKSAIFDDFDGLYEKEEPE